MDNGFIMINALTSEFNHRVIVRISDIANVREVRHGVWKITFIRNSDDLETKDDMLKILNVINTVQKHESISPIQ